MFEQKKISKRTSDVPEMKLLMSVDMRFFRNAAGKKLLNELLDSIHHMHSV